MAGGDSLILSGRDKAVSDELRRRRTDTLEEHNEAPEGLTTHPQEMSDSVLEARLNDLYVEAVDRVHEQRIEAAEEAIEEG